MIDEHIDYSKYTQEELEDALGHINREKYPERVKAIDDILGELKKVGSLDKSENAKLKDQNEFGCLEFIGLEFLFWSICGLLVLIGALIKSWN